MNQLLSETDITKDVWRSGLGFDNSHCDLS